MPTLPNAHENPHPWGATTPLIQASACQTCPVHPQNRFHGRKHDAGSAPEGTYTMESPPARKGSNMTGLPLARVHIGTATLPPQCNESYTTDVWSAQPRKGITTSAGTDAHADRQRRSHTIKSPPLRQRQLANGITTNTATHEDCYQCHQRSYTR
jgi:hypothetical protein